MDPFSALGLAGNIVQFVDFGTRISSRIYELYNSPSGLAESQTEIVDMAERLQNLAGRLTQVTSAAEEDASPIVDKKSFAALLFLCRSTAEDLISMVNDLKVDKSHKLWSSIRQGRRANRKKEQIEKLINRLKMLQDAVNSYLLALLQDGRSKVAQALQTLADEKARMDVDWKVNIQKMRDDILKEVRTLQKRSFNFDPIQLDPRDSPPKIPSMEAKMALLDANRTGLSSLSATLPDLASNCLAVLHAQQVLSGLHYPDMQFREADIRMPHHDTYDWLYPAHEQDAQSSIAKWLRNGNGIYWVAGKAGSGKSTLLKHIVRNPKTLELLRLWARPHKLVLGSYFFWNSGSVLQRSQNGLIRSLLFEIFRLCPELIQDVFPVEAKFTMTATWDRDSLMSAFERTVDLSIDRYRFCFVIDGLDEYEGDHHELVHMLKTGFNSEFMKLLVSSRPWNVFQEAFGEATTSHLFLEDYTKEDILAYVNSTMEKSPSFVELKNLDVQCEELVQEIVVRAQGVFIWVVLVVQSLVRGLTNADTVEDLQKRLDAFPRELGPFFRHMYDAIEPFYRSEAAKYFQVALTSRQAYRLLTYDLLSTKNLDATIQKYLRGREWGDSAHMTRLQHARKRVNARTQGLLETYGSDEPRVDFYHGTVRDFLRLEEMQKILISDIPEGWDVDQDLCRAFLGELKCIPAIDHPVTQHAARDSKSSVKISNVGSSFDIMACRDVVLDFFHHAFRIEHKSGRAPSDFIEDFRTTLGQALSMMQDPEIFWETPEDAADPFISAAVQSGLLHYPATMFMETPDSLSPSARQALLCSILYSGKSRFQDEYGVWEVVSSLIDCHTGHRADVNPNCNESHFISKLVQLEADVTLDAHSPRIEKQILKTPWQLFLYNLYHSDKSNTSEQDIFHRLAKLLLHAGADQKATVRISRIKTLPVKEIFEHAFEPEQTQELLELIRGSRGNTIPTIKIDQTATVNASGRDAPSQTIVNWIASWSPFRSGKSWK